MEVLRVLKNNYITKEKPFSIVHFITNRCNARCKHCFINFDDPNTFKGELTIDEIRQVTKTLGNSLFNVNLTGGEPFLRQDIYEIVQAYFENTNIDSIFITTNGRFTKLTKIFLDRFIASGLKKNIIFSLSIDNFKEAHDENRRAELYDHVIETYNLIKNYNKPNIMANVAITVTDHNYDKVIELYEYLKEKEKITAITATAMREEGVIKKIDPKIKKNIYEVYSKLVATIKDDIISGKLEGFKRGMQGTIMNSKNMIVNSMFEKIYLKDEYISHCPAGALFGVIGAEGTIYGCEILNKPLGNLRDNDLNFMKIWKNEKTQEFKKFVKDTKCHCSYECAWSINIISNKEYIPQLINLSIKQKLS